MNPVGGGEVLTQRLPWSHEPVLTPSLAPRHLELQTPHS